MRIRSLRLPLSPHRRRIDPSVTQGLVVPASTSGVVDTVREAIASLDLGTAGRVALLSAIPLLMTSVSVLIGRRRPDSEKLSAYECGFEPVGDARVRFDTFYYTVGILFLLFDLEIVLLLPYAVTSLTLSSPLALAGALALVSLLTLGFIYEWTRGALKVVDTSGRVGSAP